MFNPVATYRIQFHKGFTFAHLERIIPYLEKLGVSTIYASPIFKAVPGSMHGYDGVDPNQVNPEIGTLDELRSLSRKLRKRGISWLQDIVPNHMAFHATNTWLMDVLECGDRSVYHDYFDQNSAGNLYRGPMMAPFLGASLDAVINKRELSVELRGQELVFNYAGNQWPLSIKSYTTVLSTVKSKRPAGMEALVQEIDVVNAAETPEAFSTALWALKMQLGQLLKIKGNLAYLNQSLVRVNRSKILLKQIADAQHYRLCAWQETDHTINYRRFFTVNGLICLNIHQPKVFNDFHQLISQLIGEGIFQGLRVDHIDGLYDPAAYLQLLRKLAGPETYIIVEKILEPGETMPEWPVQGNTGYDFLATVNNLFTNKTSKTAFTDFYQQLTGDKTPVHEQISAKKALILKQSMAGEWDNLTHLLMSSGLIDAQALSAIPIDQVKNAIGEFLINCPVYRYYGNTFPLGQQEGDEVKAILKRIKKQKPDLTAAVELLAEVWLNKPGKGDKDYREKALRFYQRCMQFTGPLMAKGVEDTLMYTYNRFIDHNEVGDSPDAFGITAAGFHEAMIRRQAHWPLSMNGTATHDTKRGEGVRSRLNVLSDLGTEWLTNVKAWQTFNHHLKQGNAPDANDEFFIYQTLIGAYPMPGEKEVDFSARIDEYLEKTLREAKQHSTWAKPNLDYETATKQFAKSLLDQSRTFWSGFQTFQNKVANFGIVNSLSQVLLKFTCPGVPDVYQGCEHWDLSLVDPDNRRPVNYRRMSSLLSTPASPKILWEQRFNGQIKVALVNALMSKRKQEPLLFSEGEYLPLEVKGSDKSHVMAFARHYQRSWLIVVIPLHIASICADQNCEIAGINWNNTRVVLPKGLPETANNILLGSREKHAGEIIVSSLFRVMPFAVLKFEQTPGKRKAGVLLPVTSLPSAYGIGDFGPAAYRFADLLSASGQHYWQLLPLGPVSAQQQYSPYSSYSAFAGNELLISPELLVTDGLLDAKDLKGLEISNSGAADYASAEKVKRMLFATAMANFKGGKASALAVDFAAFCNQESAWLNDYALYTQLKTVHQDEPWHKWPVAYRQRETAALAEFAAGHQDALAQVKLLQFIFNKQWQQLKAYCHQRQLKLFGDLPFYVGHDSVDVWANPEIFSLDKTGQMQYIAGVPPDYFNTEGQLWGMPVFNWTALKDSKFKWWINRVKRNLRFYDLLRLDHFRAFSSYWAVPVGEPTAINGSWKQAPGEQLLQALEKELGEMPFVAEDLGDIDDAVYHLRDAFHLPGMKVLQFAFGDDMPGSPHIPHQYQENFIAYTGTHDNNTTRGWYRQEAGKTEKKHLKKYTGHKVNQQNVSEVLIRQALASTAQTVIVPLQDWLNLDERARINTPAATAENWLWRLTEKDLKAYPRKRAGKWTALYNR